MHRNNLQYHDTETLVDGLENNTKRYAKIVSEAADTALPQPSRLGFEEDTFDILYKQVASPNQILHLHFIPSQMFLSQSPWANMCPMQRLERMQELQAQGIEVRDFTSLLPQ